jgi:hypothetical protein
METATIGDRSDWARLLNLMLGGWLFLSAFLWPHTYNSQTNTWLVGLLIATFAVLASALPAARWLNTGAALWLFASTLVLARADHATLVNNCVVAIAVFAVSLLGPSSLERRVRNDYVDVW